MLTPEDRQRIENEERKKLAEEQYRAEVRSKLGQEPAPRENTATKGPGRLLWIVAVAAVLVIGAVILSNSRTTRATKDDSGLPSAQAASNAAPVPKTRYVPVSQKIATGQITVQANGYVQYRITITPDMVEPQITGSFNASGGSGNDVQAVIADGANYTNWINGHQAQVFWATQGKETTGSMNVRLRPGMYYLAFSNKFSAFTAKQVFLDIDLNYKKAETYY